MQWLLLCCVVDVEVVVVVVVDVEVFVVVLEMLKGLLWAVLWISNFAAANLVMFSEIFQNSPKSSSGPGSWLIFQGLRLKLRFLVFFFNGSGSKGPKKTAPDYWLSLEKYSFPLKLVSKTIVYLTIKAYYFTLPKEE